MPDSSYKERFSWAGPLAGPLGRRILAALLILSVVPLFLSSGLGYFRSTGIIHSLTIRYLQGIADLQGLHISDQLDRHIVFLRGVAAEIGKAETLDQEVLNRTLERELEQHPGFEAIYLFTPDGDIIAAAPLPPEDLQFWIGPPLKAPDDGIDVVRTTDPPFAPRLRLSVPINGTPTSLLVGAYIQVLGPSRFLELPEHTAGNVESFIVDATGRPIFVSHPHSVIDYGAPIPSFEPSDGAPSSRVYPDAQGVEVLGIYTSIPSHPWTLITEVPVENGLRELRQLRRVSIALGTFLTAVIVILGWILAYKIVLPIQRLVTATRDLAAGDLHTSVPIKERNELGQLGTAFNEMAERLAEASSRADELHRREIERAGQLATVGELAAGIAHEIKNPLAGIAGGLDLVTRRTDGNPELNEVLDEMRRQVSRLDFAVKDLLAFARPAEPNLAPMDLNHMIRRALILITPTAAKKNVTIDLDLKELPSVYADEELMRQAIVNLTMNAVQATPSGGRIQVTTQHSEADTEIRIRDTGSGISADHLDQIFKPFFTTKHQGTGLGLSITRGIVEKHGGRIQLESAKNEGTTFIVTLPLPPGLDSDGDNSGEPVMEALND